MFPKVLHLSHRFRKFIPLILMKIHEKIGKDIRFKMGLYPMDILRSIGGGQSGSVCLATTTTVHLPCCLHSIQQALQKRRILCTTFVFPTAVPLRTFSAVNQLSLVTTVINMSKGPMKTEQHCVGKCRVADKPGTKAFEIDETVAGEGKSHQGEHCDGNKQHDSFLIRGGC